MARVGPMELPPVRGKRSKLAINSSLAEDGAGKQGEDASMHGFDDVSRRPAAKDPVGHAVANAAMAAGLPGVIPSPGRQGKNDSRASSESAWGGFGGLAAGRMSREMSSEMSEDAGDGSKAEVVVEVASSNGTGTRMPSPLARAARRGEGVGHPRPVAMGAAAGEANGQHGDAARGNVKRTTSLRSISSALGMGGWWNQSGNSPSPRPRKGRAAQAHVETPAVSLRTSPKGQSPSRRLQDGLASHRQRIVEHPEVPDSADSGMDRAVPRLPKWGAASHNVSPVSRGVVRLRDDLTRAHTMGPGGQIPSPQPHLYQQRHLRFHAGQEAASKFMEGGRPRRPSSTGSVFSRLSGSPAKSPQRDAMWTSQRSLLQFNGGHFDDDEEDVSKDVKPSVFSCLEMATNGVFRRGFSSLARTNATSPWLVIFLTVSITLLFGGLGMKSKEALTETRTERLWAPQDSLAFEHDKIVTDNFGSPSTWARFIWGVPDNKAAPGVLTSSILDEVTRLDQRVWDIEVVVGGSTYHYEDICERAYDSSAAPCSSASVSDFWGRTVSDPASSSPGPSYLSSLVPTNLVSQDGRVISRSAVLGGLVTDDDGRPVSATAVMSTYLIAADADQAVQDAWMHEFLNTVERMEGEESHSILRATSISLDDEVSRSVSATTSLIGASALLVAAYLAFTLTEFDKNRYRVALGIAGVATVLLGVLGGLGSALLAGVPYTPITPVVIFVALGVGVDDVAVIVSMYDRTRKDHDIVVRNVAAMSHAGSAISVTSFTTVLAFAVGSMSSFPAVSSFSVSTAFVMLWLYGLMCTTFNAAMVLDERRHRAGLRDVFCCLRSERSAAGESVRPIPDFVRAVDPGDDSQGNSAIGQLAAATFGRALRSRKYRMLVMLAFGALAVSTTKYASDNLGEGLRTQQVVPDDSYFAEFLDGHQSHFDHIGAQVDFVIRGGDMIDDADAIADLERRIRDLSYVSGDVKSVWSAFNAWRGTEQAESFSQLTSHEQVRAFLAHHPLYHSDVVFAGPGSPLVMSRIRAFHVDLQTSPDRLAAMNEARAAAASVSSLTAFAYSPEYKVWDSYHITRSETRDSMLFAAVAVSVVMGVMAHPMATLLVLVVIGAVDVFMLSWIPLLNMHLHSVTVVCLVMSVGLAIDFSAHMAHAFMGARGSRLRRAVEAVEKMASPLITGGASTVLGVALLGVAPTESNRIFFKMIVGVVVGGIAYGFVLLPVLLVTFGPKSSSYVAHEEDDEPRLVPGARFKPRVPPPKPHPLFPWQNLVFEGGGVKGLAYGGSLDVLEEYNIIPHICRFAGCSMGSFMAMMMAIGMPAADIREMAYAYNLAKLMQDHRPIGGSILRMRAFLNNLGMNSGKKLRKFGRNLLTMYVGDPDITFQGLLELRGIELAVVVTNANIAAAEYLHVKTAPHMRIIDAVLASVAIPVVLRPTERIFSDDSGTRDMYVDGGALCNYPLHVFDGWWLSLKPEDAFLNRMRPLKNINHFFPEHIRFKRRNPKTLGFTVFHNGEADLTRKWIRDGGGPPRRPFTTLARNAARREATEEIYRRSRAKLDTAIETFLDAVQAADADRSGTLDLNEVAELLRGNSLSQEQLHLLFGTDNPTEIMKFLDIDNSGTVTFDEIWEFVSAHNFDIASRFTGLGRRDIKGPSALLSAVFDAVTVTLSRLFLRPQDKDRTVAINTDYMTPKDFNTEIEDVDFLFETGAMSCRAYIRDYCRTHGIDPDTAHRPHGFTIGQGRASTWNAQVQQRLAKQARHGASDGGVSRSQVVTRTATMRRINASRFTTVEEKLSEEQDTESPSASLAPIPADAGSAAPPQGVLMPPTPKSGPHRPGDDRPQSRTSQGGAGAGVAERKADGGSSALEVAARRAEASEAGSSAGRVVTDAELDEELGLRPQPAAANLSSSSAAAALQPLAEAMEVPPPEAVRSDIDRSPITSTASGTSPASDEVPLLPSRDRSPVTETSSTDMSAPEADVTGIGARAATGVPATGDLIVNQPGLDLRVSETVSAKISRDGDIEDMTIKGVLSVLCHKPELARARLCLAPTARVETEDLVFQTHPMVSREEFSSQRALCVPDESARGFTVGAEVAALRWQRKRIALGHTSVAPLFVSCWPEIRSSGEDGRLVIASTCEFVANESFTLRDVNIKINIGGDVLGDVEVTRCDGEFLITESAVEWQIGVIDGSARRGTLEFTVAFVTASRRGEHDSASFASVIDRFFPINVTFTSPETLGGVSIASVEDMAGNELEPARVWCSQASLEATGGYVIR